MWMRRSLCVPVCVNCGMDCLTFCCFYPLGRRNVFFTLLPEKKTLTGMNGSRLLSPPFRFVILTPIEKPSLSRLSQGPNISEP